LLLNDTIVNTFPITVTIPSNKYKQHIYQDWLKSVKTVSVHDAQGKLPEGVLLGNLLALGNYPECMEVNVKAHYHNQTKIQSFRWALNLMNKVEFKRYLFGVPFTNFAFLQPGKLKSLDTF